MMQYLLRALRFRRDFGNPVSIALCRRFFPDRALTVVDRRSGVKVRCAAGSSRIFGETWHDRDYDIPRLPLRRGDIVIDIGANQGFFACYAAWHGARVYAFEPQATALDRLLANARLNHLEEHITARPWAVSGTAGELELSITRGGVVS